MGRLARDGTAEPISRDRFLRRGRDEEMFIFPVQLTTSRIGNLTRCILTLAIYDDLTVQVLTMYTRSISMVTGRPGSSEVTS